MEHQTNTINTNVTVPLRDEFNRNKETETNTNERITKTNERSMKYRNTDNGIISTFVKLTFFNLSPRVPLLPVPWTGRRETLGTRLYFLIDVCYGSNLKGAAAIQSHVRLSISVA